jgi:quinol monooxygenase YgiN
MYTAIAKFYIKGSRTQALKAIRNLAAQVRATEPDTLTYLAHMAGDDSLRPPSHNEVTFFEVYRNKPAFLRHLKGKAFTGFLKKSGHFFVLDPQGNPFFLAEHVNRFAGFVRSQAANG